MKTALLGRSPWVMAVVAMLALGAVLALGWGILDLPGPVVGAAGPDPTPSLTPVTVSASELLGQLPRAWDRLTPIPVHSATPSLVATATLDRETVIAKLWPSPTATATPTVTPSPTPTATPLHPPADSDPTRITAPVIGLDTKVVTAGIKEQYENGVWSRIQDVPDYAAGFHEGMARPGHSGNTVISGHNNIEGQVFRYIDKLKPGDDISVWVGQLAYHYRVDAVYLLPVKDASPEVLQEDLRWISPTDDERLTLLTCWPYWSNTHRTIVVAFPVP
jgi:LPXTG-site transpeptidase (sortase) family protein